jgi:acetolactate synthase-1/2/3 large subunit
MDGFEACAQLHSASSEQFDSVLAAVGSKPWGTDLATSAVENIRRILTDNKWLPGSVFAALQETMGAGACFVADTGAFCTVAEHVWQATTPSVFLASANGRYMGTSVPMAIGAALARQTVPTLCVMGDGGIRPFWAEMKTAIADRLPICFVLISDGRYGSVVASASAPGLTPSAVEVYSPSWFKAAAALGCEAHNVTSLDELTRAVSGWRFDNGPCFIEAPFDKNAYAAMTADVR